jgi:2-polyprenyl-3-methyl-5-hydroxy-6-metoxy-1,4-benzoquinol methylase
MLPRRVALIYDDTARPETTGTYCLRALRGLAEVEHFLPGRADRIPRGFDLYLEVDDGLEHRLPAGLRPCAWWAIDTHLRPDWCLAKAPDFDLVFAAQLGGAELLRRGGAAGAAWLPLACDPEVHRKLDVPKEHDFCFVGNLFPGGREELVGLLRARFPRHFVGRAYFEDMARTYSASRVVFNRSVRDDVNMRVFEALACGSLLVTNDLPKSGQGRLFRDGAHLAAYQTADELLDKVRFYLDRGEAREKIAAAGREEVLARHTYRHRMQAVLAAADRLPTRAAVPGPVPDPAPAAPVPAEDPARQCRPEDARDAFYFDFARPELLALVPAAARRVLDVGCGAGRLGEALKARQQAEVVGVECDPRAARAAAARLDRVLACDVEREETDFTPGTFDAAVCGDVLEHLREPGHFLRRLRDWLRPGGVLVVSVPNVRHHSVVNGLLAGNWTYEAAGLLDRTHLRFFTRRTAVDLLELAGFRVRDVKVVPGPGHREWEAAGRAGEVRAGGLHVRGLAPEEAEEFYAYQYLITAGPALPEKSAPGVPDASAKPETWRPTAPAFLKAVRERGPMRFTQDFVRDFDQFDFFGPPFAFVRFADGERAVCQGSPVEVPRDGWAYPGGASPLAADLDAALRYSAPDYYVGISDACCDRDSRDWYLARLGVPLHQVTFSNVFINWNYRRFRQLDLRRAVVVASRGGDFAVPEDVFATPFDLDALVARLFEVDRPILVSAGPASEVIIHKYWLRAAHRQTIVDVGSALDERTKGARTRPYHHPGTRTAELVCHW